MLVLFIHILISATPEIGTASSCAQKVISFVFDGDAQPLDSRLTALKTLFANSGYDPEEVEIFNLALQQMVERNERIPQLLPQAASLDETDRLAKENLVIGERWKNLILNREHFATLKPVDLTDDFKPFRQRGPLDGVKIQLAEVRNVPLVFRIPTGNSTYGTLRKTSAMSGLNEMMSLSTVPASRWIVFQSDLILASRYLKGYVPIPYIPTHYDAWSVADAEGFEFLAGQTDGNENNLRVESDSHLYVIDHNLSLISGIPKQNLFSPLGARLPSHYTKRFIKALRMLKRSTLISRFGHLLTLDEIDSIMLRREILLIDFEKNKDRKLIYGP